MTRADLVLLLEAVAAIAALTRRVERLEVDAKRNRGARDEADERLLASLRTLVPAGGSFSAQDVMDRGALDPGFRELLLAADLEDAAGVGYLLRRCRGVSGLERLGRNGAGVLWTFEAGE